VATRTAATSPPRIVVVGAGLAGLIAAVEAARAGAEVTVLDGAGYLGGRAHTTCADGFARNLGPHAVYRRGELARTLRRLGVAIPGAVPRLDKARLRLRGEVVGGARLARLSLPLPRLLARRPDPGATVTAWLDGAGLTDDQRAVVQAGIRTATYVHAPDVQDAVSAHAQLRRGAAGVTYVHGGWSTLVDGVSAEVANAGGRVRRSAAVRTVHHDRDGVHSVALSDGSELPADGVVVAVGGPRDAARLLAGDLAAELAGREDLPARMATLDVTLDRAPRRWPAQVFGDGDDPRYWLVQSRFAHIAPEDGDVVHVARYLAPGERADAHTRADLEALFDEVQPGWRARVRDARFLPNMTVVHALPLAAHGGLADRAPVTTGVPGLALAGDSFGAVGQLADAAAASAVTATATVLADLEWRRSTTPARRSPTPAGRSRTPAGRSRIPAGSEPGEASA
jgi:phytoene dehydrogenase-like protein